LARPIDAELAAMSVLVPVIDIDDPVAARAIDRMVTAEVQGEVNFSGLTVTDHAFQGRDGRSIPLRSYAAEGLSDPRPVMILIHGGCFVIGGLHSEDARCARLARESGATIVAVDYRLSPEHRYPAAFEDCVDALEWVRAQDRFDPNRIGIGGISAGGALACAVALADTHPIRLSLLMLLHAVLDGNATSPSVDEFPGNPVLDSATVHKMWRAYLGDHWRAGRQVLPGSASPAHADRLEALPPTFMAVAELDPLRDEGFAFAERLQREGVRVTFRYYPHAFHSFDSFTATRMAREAIQHQADALRDYLV
jgi:acetyl esterase/lipase